MNEETSHVFIIRLWHEPGTEAYAAPEWRAIIENVNTRQRFPIRDMSAVQTLLAPFGDDMGLNDFLAS